MTINGRAAHRVKGNRVILGYPFDVYGNICGNYSVAIPLVYKFVVLVIAAKVISCGSGNLERRYKGIESYSDVADTSVNT